MQQQMQITPEMLENSETIKTPNGGVVFHQGFILRKVSKFLTGQDQDGIIPIPVFYDPETGKVLEGMVPEMLKEDLKDNIING